MSKMYDRFFDLDNVEYDFFYKEIGLEKTAATKVSDSSASWETDILRKISEEKSFVLEGTDYIIKLKEVDNERGYAFGSIIISNVPPLSKVDMNSQYNSGFARQMQEVPTMQDKAKHVFIPITIKNFKLDDFDIFVQDGQPRVLTEQNFARYMFQSESFGNAVRTQGDARHSYDELADAQSPPYSSNRQQVFRSSGFLTYAAAGMEKTAGTSSSTTGILTKLLPTIRPEHRKRLRAHVGSEHIAAAFAGTPQLEIIDKILKGGPLTSEDATVAFKDKQVANVVRIRRIEHDKYNVTRVSDRIYDPRTKEMDLLEVMKEFKEESPDLVETVAALDIDKDVVLTINHDVRPLAVLEDYTADFKLLKESGGARAITTSGDIVDGHFLKEVYDPNGDKSAGHLFLDGDNWAYQTGIVGEPGGCNAFLKEGSLHSGVWGTFMFSKDGALAALTPFRVIAVSSREGSVVVKAQDLYANDINFIMTPCIEKIVNLTGNQSLEVGGFVSANSFAIPQSYKFIHLGYRTYMEEDPTVAATRVNRKLIIEGWASVVKKDQIYGNSAGSRKTLVIKHADGDYNMSGPALYPITKHDNPSHVNRSDAFYRLVLLGADKSTADKILARAKVKGVITVSNCKNLEVGETKLAAAERVSDKIEEAVSYLNRDLTKEAGALAADDSVDTVLSLSFINPENLSTYLQSMERLEQAENDLAQLLLLVRLGLENSNETAVVNALRNLSEVNEDLRFINFLIENKKVQAAS